MRTARRGRRPHIAPLAPLAPLALLPLALAACSAERPVAPAPAGPAPALDLVALGGEKKSGAITIALAMRPRSGADVPFTTTGKKVRDFALDDDDDPTLPHTVTFDKLKAGTYTVQMASTPEGALTHLRCTSSGVENNVIDLASRSVTIALEEGEAVACIFVDGWEAGDLVTYPQIAWGTSGSAATALLSANFLSAYPAGYVEIGIPGSAGYSAIFTAPSWIVTYLPASGALGALTSDLIDPGTTPSGAFGGEVLGLTLNVDLSGSLGGSSGVPFGALALCGLSNPSLNGTSVSGLLALANTLLGGGSNGYSFIDLGSVIQPLNSAFAGGAPSTFAQDHLFVGACP